MGPTALRTLRRPKGDEAIRRSEKLNYQAMFPAGEVCTKPPKVFTAFLLMPFEKSLKDGGVLNFAHGFLPNVHMTQVAPGEPRDEGFQNLNEVAQLFEDNSQAVNTRGRSVARVLKQKDRPGMRAINACHQSSLAAPDAFGVVENAANIVTRQADELLQPGFFDRADVLLPLFEQALFLFLQSLAQRLELRKEGQLLLN